MLLHMVSIYLVFLCLFDVQNFAGNENLFRKNSQKEFPTPLAGRADQVLQNVSSIFFTPLAIKFMIV